MIEIGMNNSAISSSNSTPIKQRISKNGKIKVIQQLKGSKKNDKNHNIK